MPLRVASAEASGMPSGERLGKAALKVRGVGLVENKYFLAAAGRGYRRRDGRQLEMTSDARAHRR